MTVPQRSTTTAPTPPPNSININNLGYFLDGWADIVEGFGDKTEEVRIKVLKQLKEREMPEIESRQMTGYVSLVSNERRAYLINTTNPGATTTVYIGKHGKDLFCSWRTFIRPVLNNQVIIATLVICALIGLVIGGIQEGGGFYGPSQTTFSFFGWLESTIVFLIIAVIGLAFAGRIFKGNFLAYFFVEPNVFDAEDIAAMGLSTHKTLIRALDEIGIDISKLRIKQNFKGGRRGEEV